MQSQTFDEPLKDYISYFRDLHKQNVLEYFNELVNTSKVDPVSNQNTVAELYQLESAVAKVSSTRKWWRFTRVLCIFVAVAGGVVAGVFQGLHFLWLIGSAGFLALVFSKINPSISSLNDTVSNLEGKKNDKSDQAWREMQPLNDLFTWEVSRKLFQKTFPEVEFDSHFTSGRLFDLITNYGLPSNFTESTSVVYSLSGAINQNPFVMTRHHDHWIGSQQYFGSLIIYWTEQVQNAQGQWMTVQRSQTLSASVIKPFPEYHYRSLVIYGHEAAPNLSFSRGPNELSGMDEGFRSNRKKRQAIKKFEKQVRKDVKTGSGELSVMSNREFEALFNAIDRDHEVEFRFLFTALAQQEMVDLLKDKEHGFGDNFAFVKDGTINIVDSVHLNNTRLDSNPNNFINLDFEVIKKKFLDFQHEFFRSLYFSLAPLMLIPAYREKRVSGSNLNSALGISEWEHESMAHYLDGSLLSHPSSITENILKTSATSVSEHVDLVSIVSHGYMGIPQVDYIPILGGDGRVHPVPVPWTDYVPVQQESTMLVGIIQNPDSIAESTVDDKLVLEWLNALEQYGLKPENSFIRGALTGALIR